MIDIVQASEAQIPEVIDLWKELIDYHMRINPLWTRKEDGHLAFSSFLREMMASPDAKVLLAVDDGRVIGYTIAKIGSHPPVLERTRFGLIVDMAVSEGHRREGAGERMLEGLMDWFDSLELEAVEVKVAVGNGMGQAFWQKQGFRTYINLMRMERP